MADANDDINNNWSETSSYNENDFLINSDDEVYDDEEVEEMPLAGANKSSNTKLDVNNTAAVGDVRWTKSGFTASDFDILEEEPQYLLPTDPSGSKTTYFRRFWTKEIM